MCCSSFSLRSCAVANDAARASLDSNVCGSFRVGWSFLFGAPSRPPPAVPRGGAFPPGALESDIPSLLEGTPGGAGATPPCVNPKLGSRVVGHDVTRQCAGSVSLRVSTTLSPSRRPTPKLLPASPNPLPFACPPLKEALALFRSSNGWSFTCVQNPRSPSGAPPDTGSVGVAAAVDTYPAALTILCIF